MLILFDQGTPVSIRDALTGHTVKTAYEQGWATLLNGELLRAAEGAGFDVLVTTDSNLPYQQNLADRKLAVVILKSHRWPQLQRALPQIVLAIEKSKPGSWVEVPAPPK